MTKRRLAFAGIGWIGRQRMEAMLATGLAECVAIFEPDAACREEALRLAPLAAVVPDFDALLSCHPDGVIIASPSALHAGQSIAALEAGAAVFCQKPLGRSAREVEAVLAAAREADRMVGVDFSYRDTAAAQAVARLVASGAIGEVRSIDLVFHNAYGPDKDWFYDPALAGGGCLIDLGIHLVDLMLWALNFPGVAVVAARLQFRSEGVEDRAMALIELDTGATAQLACSWHLPAGRDAAIRAAFYGSTGAAVFRNVNGSFYDFTAERFTGTARTPLVGPPDAWSGRTGILWLRKLAEGGRYGASTSGLRRSALLIDGLYDAADRSLAETHTAASPHQPGFGPGMASEDATLINSPRQRMR